MKNLLLLFSLILYSCLATGQKIRVKDTIKKPKFILAQDSVSSTVYKTELSDIISEVKAEAGTDNQQIVLQDSTIVLDRGGNVDLAPLFRNLGSAQGVPGIPGEDGKDGLSAYDLWLNDGNTGTIQDYQNSLIGPEGPQGPPGTGGSDTAEDIVTKLASITDESNKIPASAITGLPGAETAPQLATKLNTITDESDKISLDILKGGTVEGAVNLKNGTNEVRFNGRNIIGVNNGLNDNLNFASRVVYNRDLLLNGGKVTSSSARSDNTIITHDNPSQKVEFGRDVIAPGLTIEAGSFVGDGSQLTGVNITTNNNPEYLNDIGAAGFAHNETFEVITPEGFDPFNNPILEAVRVIDQDANYALNIKGNGTDDNPQVRFQLNERETGVTYELTAYVDMISGGGRIASIAGATPVLNSQFAVDSGKQKVVLEFQYDGTYAGGMVFGIQGYQADSEINVIGLSIKEKR